MIGIKLRGVRHLWRLADTSLNYILARGRDGNYDLCEVVKTPADHKYGEKMFIFNQSYNHNSNEFDEVSNEKWLKDITDTFERRKVISVRKATKIDSLNRLNDLCYEIILLPKSFKKDYIAFIKENNKMMKVFEQKYCFDPLHTYRLMLFYAHSNGSKNFFNWAVNLYFSQGIRSEIIISILEWNEDYSHLTKNLSKGTITAYTTRESTISLMDELSELRNKKRLNDAINSFNTAQKKMLKKNELSDGDKKTLARFTKLSDTKKINFIKKVSTIDDFSELMRQLRHVTSTHFSWNKESFMDFINNVEGIDHEIIIDNGDVVLTKVNDYETIKQFAKTTNWCISKNKSYWNNYISHHGGRCTQYMLFDFSKMEDDKLSIVGFTTTRNRGITSAHNFVNDNLMGKQRQNDLFMSSFIAKFIDKKDIFSIIKDCEIDMTLFMDFDKTAYKWDRESLMEYLFECVNSENVDIIPNNSGDDNKIVLSVTDRNIRYFFGDAYIDNMSSEYWDMQHILFIDFSKSQFDPNRIQFALVMDGNFNEDYCEGIYDIFGHSVMDVDFDIKLVEFGLPYNIIRRRNDEVAMADRAFMNFNSKLLLTYVNKDKDILRKVFDDMDDSVIFNCLSRSMTEYNSFDYINMVYDNGYRIHKLCDEFSSELLLKLFMRYIKNCPDILTNGISKPTDEMIEIFHKGMSENLEYANHVGTYLQFKMVFDHEIDSKLNYNRLYSRMLTKIASTSSIRGRFLDELLTDMSGRLDFRKKGDPIRNFFNVVILRSENKALQDKLLELSNTSEYTKKCYNEALAYKKTLSNESTPVSDVVFAEAAF